MTPMSSTHGSRRSSLVQRRRGLLVVALAGAAAAAALMASPAPGAFVEATARVASRRALRASSPSQGSGRVTVAAAQSGAAALSDPEFEAALMDGAPFVAEFHSAWCGPCKLMSKVLDDVEQQLSGRVRVLKLDIDGHMGLAGGFKVRKVPTVLLFGGGSPEPVQSFVGLAKGEDLRAAIEAKLLGQ
mmetsp:Transcript_38629/g.82143  ORF Transcript_38629/g.82143 Transcript_38629/m.82143 type:complete len:187 (-) Transcript_38629:40-600(-)